MSDQTAPRPDIARTISGAAQAFHGAAEAFRCLAQTLDDARRRPAHWTAVSAPRGWPFPRA